MSVNNHLRSLNIILLYRNLNLIKYKSSIVSKANKKSTHSNKKISHITTVINKLSLLN